MAGELSRMAGLAIHMGWIGLPRLLAERRADSLALRECAVELRSTGQPRGCPTGISLARAFEVRPRIRRRDSMSVRSVPSDFFGQDAPRPAGKDHAETVVLSTDHFGNPRTRLLRFSSVFL